jgi:hypothetical protein
MGRLCRYVGNVRHLRPFFNMNKYQYKKPTIETVDVSLPSGNVIKMQKPSKYQVLFNIKAMPASLTEHAISSWQEQGVGSEVEDAVANTNQEDRLRLMEMSFKIRDDVLRLSVEPKIVMDQATDPEKGVVNVDDIADTDLDFLFKWVASGGIAAPAVADFRDRPKQDVVDSTSGKARKPKTVAVGGAE